jgi:threonine aldolase
MSGNMIDLRSDTVTRPTPQMYAAMATARLGDDGWRDDPTVLELEEHMAALLGKPAALFVPSSTFANMVAMLAHAPGRGELIAEAKSYILAGTGNGAYASVAGLTARPIPGVGGAMDLAALEAAISPDGGRISQPTVLISVESSHTVASGAVPSLAHMQSVADLARRAGIPLYLDGARLFNAAAALDMPLARLAAQADSVGVSLCKGLGAPAGAILAGDAAFIRRALAFRRTLGGAMRQVGLLAACALAALREPMDHFHQDHARARALGEGLHKLDPAMIDLNAVVTNLLTVDVRHTGRDAAAWTQALAARGVRVAPIGARTLRLITHRDIHPSHVEAALEAFGAVRQS